MAQYKVPQDVEADDKLLGPFTFRQFVYLMIMGGCVGLGFALFNVFPLLALIPVPFAIFFAILALPLKKDQPMETYLAAIVSFHLKPTHRFWNPGQRESTIEITAPKIVEQPRTRDLTEEEAGNRLSFLANVIDTEGYAIRGDINNTPMRAQFLAEAEAVPDMMDATSSTVINQKIAEEQNARHQELVNQMREAINRAESVNNTPVFNPGGVTINPIATAQAINPAAMPATQPVVPQTIIQPTPTPVQPQPAANPAMQAKLKELADNKDFSVQTLSKEAARAEKKQQEVVVNLH